MVGQVGDVEVGIQQEQRIDDLMHVACDVPSADEEQSNKDEHILALPRIEVGLCSQ